MGGIKVHLRRPFAADEERIGRWHVLRVTGEIGSDSAGLLWTLVVYAVRRGARNVCLDLSDLESVSGIGPAAVLRCARAARHMGGRLALIPPRAADAALELERSGVRGLALMVGDRDELAGPVSPVGAKR
jgi:anti-anti-sigma regulatory factor